MTGTTDSLSTLQARRIALAAQGFTDRAHATPSLRTLERTLARTGVLQVDSVNVPSAPTTCRSTRGWVPTTGICCAARRNGARAGWSSTGRTSRPSCPSTCGRRAEHRMDGYREQRGKWGFTADPALEPGVLAAVRERGPVTARDLEEEFSEGPRTKEHWGWNWSQARKVLDYLFLVGDVAIAGRTAQFEVLYDVPERVLPAAVLAAPTPKQGRRRPRGSCAVPPGRTGSPRCAAWPTTTGCRWSTRRPAVEHAPRDRRADPGLTVPGWKRARRTSNSEARLATASVGARAPALPVRPGRVGAIARRDALRLLLPDRDLRPSGQARPRLLRAALPAGGRPSWPGSTSRPTGPPGACWSRACVRRARSAAGDPGGADGRAGSASPAGSTSTDVVVGERGDLAGPTGPPSCPTPRWEGAWRQAKMITTAIRPPEYVAQLTLTQPRSRHHRACHHRQAPPHRRRQDPAPARGDRQGRQRHRGRLRLDERRRAAGHDGGVPRAARPG